jgi:hypothetical protein
MVTRKSPAPIHCFTISSSSAAIPFCLSTRGAQILAHHLFAQRMTASGVSVWPDCASQLAPVSPSVFAAWFTKPAFDKHVALTMTSSTEHMAGFAIPPSAAERTTRNWSGGDTPSFPFCPGLPAGPCCPFWPCWPGGPASPLSPLSPFGPEKPATIRVNVKALVRPKILGISNPASCMRVRKRDVPRIVPRGCGEPPGSRRVAGLSRATRYARLLDRPRWSSWDLPHKPGRRRLALLRIERSNDRARPSSAAREQRRHDARRGARRAGHRASPDVYRGRRHKDWSLASGHNVRYRNGTRSNQLGAELYLFAQMVRLIREFRVGNQLGG